MLCARNPEVDVTAIWRPTYPPCPRRAPSRLLSHAYVKMLATVEAGAGAPRVASSRAATSRPAGPFRMAARRSKLQLRQVGPMCVSQAPGALSHVAVAASMPWTLPD